MEVLYSESVVAKVWKIASKALSSVRILTKFSRQNHSQNISNIKPEQAAGSLS